MTQRLENYIVRDALCSRLASGTVVAHMLVTLDLSADAEGGKVKAIGALTHKPFGVVEEGATDGIAVGVIQGGKVAIVCVDSSINPDVEVFNDVGGKVSATQGTGAFRVGRTRSKTSGANELVTVELDLPV